MMKKAVVSALVGLALTGTFVSTQAAVTIENEVIAFKGKILKVEVHNATTNKWIEIQGETPIDKLGTTIKIEKNASELDVGVYDLLRYNHKRFEMQGQVTVKGTGKDWDGTYRAVKDTNSLITQPKNPDKVYGFFFEKGRTKGEDILIPPGIKAENNDFTTKLSDELKKKYTKEYVKELVRIAAKDDELRTEDERKKYRTDYSGIPHKSMLEAEGTLGYYDQPNDMAYEITLVHFEVKEKEGKKYIDGSSDVVMNYDAHEGLWSHAGWKKGNIQWPKDRQSSYNPVAAKEATDKQQGTYYEYTYSGGTEKYEYFTGEDGKKYLRAPYAQPVAPTADNGSTTPAGQDESINKYPKTPPLF